MPRRNHAPVLVADTKNQTSHAKLFKVLVHNDDKSTFQLVEHILVTVFHLPVQKAKALTMEVHTKGVALAAVETLEQAEFHVDQSNSIARGNGFPLSLSIEPA